MIKRLIPLGALAFFTALPALAQPPAVITDIAPVGSLVQAVMGDLGAPEVLLPAGSNPHQYQLRPSQARALQDAGLLIWVGPELTPWLARTSENLSANLQSLPLLALPETHRRDYGAGHDDEHAHEHGDDHDHDHEAEDHAHSGTDSHAWIDPENGKLWLEAIARALSEADPENAATYAANAKAASAGIDEVTTELTAELAPFASAQYAVFHDAYGYFSERFGLQPAVAISLGDASTPSAARLTEIRAQIRDKQVRCAFPEANHDARLVDRAIEGTDARLGEPLDPLGSELPLDAALYPQMLRGLGKTFAECLGKP